ncbi:MAG: YlmC/YmxH family sporulation protein [Bacilli bacterium]|nr:YlmC/YmxH family sporulation protein [Bacilli bacterium]
MKLSELSNKDVIRDEDGTKLGRIEDITIDTATGKIMSIHVNSGFRLSGIFSLSEGIMIPWNKIVKIGSDVIIVETVHNIKMEIDNKT